MARRRQRKREQPTRPPETRRIRPELRPVPRAVKTDDAPVESIAPAGPDRAAAGGTAVGILLGIGVLLGAIVAWFVGLSILPSIGIGGVIGAIAGIIIDRRRAARSGETRR